MSYEETNCNLCKTCYVKLKRPSKKAIKKMVMTTYKDKCENCGRVDRLVDYMWEDDVKEE